ncbi:hypothetical protein RSOL_031890 [Rhizoctonia solani AG-3 Rhs1AP]|uniref:Uncharacterized protein n=2 Tax=Rhizoctonia solani AG-3 TaxID=1086053 RepID=A0A074RL76_9AGAM|nr:hypothetical protein RSOL_031890 [Rhizoctonia solani AG-3 Rhs1AP]KEP47574.1 hypothetical protein V565_150970 [Rhizoctonia solani 123E]
MSYWFDRVVPSWAWSKHSCRVSSVFLAALNIYPLFCRSLSISFQNTTQFMHVSSNDDPHLKAFRSSEPRWLISTESSHLAWSTNDVSTMFLLNFVVLWQN